MTNDCVQVSSKGSLTGGYFNKSRSRLEIQKIRSEKSEEIREQEEEMRKLRDDLATLEAEINKVRGAKTPDTRPYLNVVFTCV
jgi:structural maintenance of chromosome 3 (chondroitin sulfate proteoglycan 6)